MSVMEGLIEFKNTMAREGIDLTEVYLRRKDWSRLYGAVQLEIQPMLRFKNNYTIESDGTFQVAGVSFKLHPDDLQELLRKLKQ